MTDERVSILLVEDNPGDARLLEEMLKEEALLEFTLTVAPRLQTALDWLEHQSCDIVLLDLSLPDSSGLATFTTLHHRWPDVPTVVLTGLSDEDLAVRAVQEGSQDYLVKGEVTSGILVRSIRYAMERQRTSNYVALMMERERFDTAVSQMSDGIIVTDGNYRMVTVNRSAQLLLNLPDSAADQPLRTAFDDFELSLDPADVFATKQRVTAFEIAREQAGPPLYVDARITRLFDSRGSLGCAVLMLRDVTAERREQRAQVDFFNLVSHKLRTPLTVLSGYLDILKDVPSDRWDGEAQHLVAVCRREVGRLSGTVQRLLDFKRVSASQVELSTHHTSVLTAVTHVAQAVRERYPDRQINLRLNLDPGVGYADARPEDLSFALDQVLDNAIKFAGESAAAVDVAVRAQEDSIRFTITDTGPGIPHEYLDRIFDGFVQIEAVGTGNVPGLGVGLRLARQAITANGGTLSIRSNLGEGTTVWFDLPRAEDPGRLESDESAG